MHGLKLGLIEHWYHMNGLPYFQLLSFIISKTLPQIIAQYYWNQKLEAYCRLKEGFVLKTHGCLNLCACRLLKIAERVIIR